MKLHVYPPLRCFHSILDFIKVFFTKSESFDKFFDRWFGSKDYFCTYRGRNGLYHILYYLKKNFHISRVIVPSYICKIVIPPIKMNNLEVVFVDNNLKTLGIDENSLSLKKNDVLLWVNYFDLLSQPSKKLLKRRDLFIIEDNASYFRLPSSFADFTLYSFGKGKQISSSEGGIVSINNAKFKLLNKTNLNLPSFKTELSRYIEYFLWRLITFRPIYVIGKKLNLKNNSESKSIKARIDGNNLSMCNISKKLVYEQLKRMPNLISKSRVLAKTLIEKLKNINGLNLLTSKHPSNYFYVNMIVEDRDSLKSYLEKKNIFCSIPWEYSTEYILNKKSHNNADYILNHILQIKIDPTYMEKDDVKFIENSIKSWFNSKRMVSNSQKIA